MSTSQNGWPAMVNASSSLLHTWVIPAKSGEVRVTLRNGSAGFLLCHFLLWFAEKVQPLAGRIVDDWGYAFRPIRGETTGLSNHASGTAADANATQHPLGKAGTFTPLQSAEIRKKLARYSAAIRWGGDYHGRKDEMHFEINVSLSAAEVVARRLMKTKRGQRLLAANPGQKEVILS